MMWYRSPMMDPTRSVDPPRCSWRAAPSLGQNRSVSGYSMLQVGQIFADGTTQCSGWREWARLKDARIACAVTLTTTRGGPKSKGVRILRIYRILRIAPRPGELRAARAEMNTL